MSRDIWWGDVVRAQQVLGTRTADEFGAVAKALGFDVADVRADPSEPTPELVPNRPDDAPHQQDPGTTSADTFDDGPDTGVTTPSVLKPIAREEIVSPLATGPVLARPAEVEYIPMLRHRPLLSPSSANGIVQYLLSRMVMDGPVDLAALVDAIAAGRPSAAMPRQRLRTLRFGVQVLVDLGENMRPFRRDQTQLVDSVRAVVGPALTSVRYFADAPLRGVGTGPRWTWRDYEVPAPGSRVLLVTDFGLGGDWLSLDRSTPTEWSELFDVLHRRNCQPVALVPYPPSRWPPRLRARCQMLMWDRNVTVGHARTATS